MRMGSGGTNFRAALDSIRQIDSTRLTHYEGFGIGSRNPAGMDSQMYTDVESLEKKGKGHYAKETFLPL